MHYPPVSAAIENAAPSQGEDWNLPAGMKDRKAVVKIQDSMWPLRKSFMEDSTQGKILTNHFTYTLTTEKLYEYKIIGLPAENINRQVKKQNFETALRACSFLQPHKDSFATNDIDTIVAWKPIHEQISSDFTMVTNEELDDQEKVEYSKMWRGLKIPNGRSELPLRFALLQQMNVKDLNMYSSAHPNHEKTNFVDISRCLNILISHSLTTDVHKQSANKFFVKTARNQLSYSCLETVRGYFYNVKPGMGNVIVNFNLATSAFVRPMLICEFVNDRTFSPAEAQEVLKKLRVFVEYERYADNPDKTAHFNKESNRTWSGCTISEIPIGQLTFREKKRDVNRKAVKIDGGFVYEGPETSVIDHLKTGKMNKCYALTVCTNRLT